MSKEIELKPCPFCGKPAKVDFFGEVGCEDSACYMYERGLEVPRWNRRPIEDAQAARIARLEGALWTICGYIPSDDCENCVDMIAIAKEALEGK